MASLQQNVVYKATVTETKSKKSETYIGLTKNNFKQRYTAHKLSFNLPYKRSETSLSEHVWSLKTAKKDFTIKWEVLERKKQTILTCCVSFAQRKKWQY